MDEASRDKLWQKFAKTRSAELRDELIIEYAQLVKIVAGRLCMYLGYSVEYEDLVSYGIFGLIDAIDKFENNKGVKFETYASIRIRGEILDQIRKMDWLPRSLRAKQKSLNAAISKIEASTGRTATDEEIANELGITGEELASWQGETCASHVISLEEISDDGVETAGFQAIGAGKFETPEESVEKEEIRKKLVEAIDCLTDRERLVVTLYYYEELTLREISMTLEITESRVCQLHSRAIGKMRNIMGDYIGILH